MLIPTIIAGRYQVRRRLGSGAQGEVYEVLDTHEGDVVALKLLSAIPGGGPWTEARILRHLADPHILPIRNADVASGRPYLVTDLASHGTLSDRLAVVGGCGLEVDDVVRWVRQACNGLARAHDVSLLHNDVKPANLFLNAQSECMVADFGFAAAVPAGARSTTPPGATAETAAPEVASGWGTPATTASVESDVYSLGATGFWLLAGRAPHDLSAAPDVAAKMAIVAGSLPAKLRDLAPHVPSYVGHVLEKAIERSQRDRYATVTQLAAALGSRPAAARRWRRTDEHPGHLACWRGEARAGSIYVLCLETGARPSQCVVTAIHDHSGRRILRGCRTEPLRLWGQAVRSAIRALG